MNQGNEENEHRNYFMINLHESIRPSQDQTHDPWICSGTHYRLSDRQTDKHRQTDRQMDGWMYRLTDGQIDGWTDRQTQMDRRSCRQTDTQTDRQRKYCLQESAKANKQTLYPI